jgi:hypothetical protein
MIKNSLLFKHCYNRHLTFEYEPSERVKNPEKIFDQLSEKTVRIIRNELIFAKLVFVEIKVNGYSQTSSSSSSSSSSSRSVDGGGGSCQISASRRLYKRSLAANAYKSMVYSILEQSDRLCIFDYFLISISLRPLNLEC